jgi:hypothetical protein
MASKKKTPASALEAAANEPKRAPIESALRPGTTLRDAGGSFLLAQPAGLLAKAPVVAKVRQAHVNLPTPA